ncbi:MAG: hypothetical protein FJ030_04850 [Chloroflexi bacterium]|nr:hypothetical protein [Chloroflexota bacterium]
MAKTDGGESGIGHHIFRPGGDVSAQSIFGEMESDPYLRNDIVIVEEYIDSPNHLSPSLEVYVPPRGEGEPRITYLSNQLFLGLSDFYGLLIDREQTRSQWYPALAESGLLIARRLQEMGYAGHFDLDTVVDDSDRVYLLELNSRRTAGTHVHEFACHYFGPNYLDVLYPMAGQRRGVIFAVTSILAANEFGCIIVAESTGEALALHQQLRGRIQNSPR